MKAKRKIDDEKLLQLHAEGMSQADIGKVFNCSQYAVSKRLGRILPPPPSKLDDLTPSQAEFSKCVASGMSPTNAALQSYDCTSRDSAKTIGKRLMQQDDIRATIEELMNDCGLTRGYRVRKLKSHCDNVDPHLSLKALSEAFKIAGDYAPQQVETYSIHDLRALLAIVPDHPAIEVKPS